MSTVNQDLEKLPDKMSKWLADFFLAAIDYRRIGPWLISAILLMFVAVRVWTHLLQAIAAGQFA